MKERREFPASDQIDPSALERTVGKCCSPESILRFQRNELTDKEANEVRRHICACADCARDMKIAATLIKKERTIVRKIISDEFARKTISALSPRNVAAVILAGLVIVFALSSNREVGKPWLIRGSQTALEIPRSTDISASNGQFELHWNHLEGIDAYTVELFGPEFEFIWRSENIRGNSCLVPVSKLLPQPRGTIFYWRITGNRNGKPIKSNLGEIRFRKSRGVDPKRA